MPSSEILPGSKHRPATGKIAWICEMRTVLGHSEGIRSTFLGQMLGQFGAVGFTAFGRLWAIGRSSAPSGRSSSLSGSQPTPCHRWCLKMILAIRVLSAVSCGGPTPFNRHCCFEMILGHQGVIGSILQRANPILSALML